MGRHLRPDRFDTDPNSPNGADAWEHWYYTFTHFLGLVEERKPDKLKTRMHFLSPTVYKFVSRCTDNDSAITTLQSLYMQTKNEIFARHLLATSKQSAIETLDQFMQKLRNLARDCNFKAVSAKQNEEDAIRDAFINGLLSNPIRQRLLENKTLDVSTAYDQAKALDLAQQQSQTFAQVTPSICAAAASTLDQTPETTLATSRTSCFFCGYDRHPCHMSCGRCNLQVMWQTGTFPESLPGSCQLKAYRSYLAVPRLLHQCSGCPCESY
ncbi:unnamed protein product [Echinostoma caproni]|uniref:Retrotrans_gag domain-containing protein n=1 Tax=Echinostoma caproni TaxID=27848 RepID=A0A183AYK4_9TREM|nr:unnamed protein product [Echinostoma caproni]